MILAAVFGLLAGALVDVRIRRVAAREEPSGTPLDSHLRGDRRRLLIVPVLSSLACLFASLRWDGDPVLIPFLFFLPLLAGLAVVDLHTRRLPNALTLPCFLGGLALVIGLAVVGDDPGTAATALASAVLLFGVLLGLNLLRPSGMGMGDVKLAGLIGLFVGLLGLGPALLAVALSALLAGLAGLALITAGRITRRTPVPFGPWLAAGTLISVLAGPELVHAYLGALGA